MPAKLTTEYVRSFLKTKGYDLITPTYENAKQQLQVICTKGHTQTITFSRVGYRNQRCNLCVRIESMFSIEYVRKVFENEGYTLLSKSYDGARSKLEIRCPNGHIWLTNLNKFKDCNQRCPLCSFAGGNSKMEQELLKFIISQYPTAQKLKVRRITISRRPYIKGFDIDIYIPELNKGIEFDGTYYHSFNGLRRGKPKWTENGLKNYHTIKDEYFKSKGIDILHIKEENWIKDREKCLEIIFAFLG